MSSSCGTPGPGHLQPATAQRSVREAVSVAASFACAIQTQESLLDLLFVGPRLLLHAGRGLAHADQMLAILARFAPAVTNLSTLLHNWCSIT